jgi:geranylgeranyl reductase family protein
MRRAQIESDFQGRRQRKNDSSSGEKMKFDVTVVGAGPAGSTAAKFLSEKGFNTLLMDKKKFPRDKPCGGGLPLRVLRQFPYVANDEIIEAYSSSGTVFSPSLNYSIQIKKNRPIISTTLRKKFDFTLVQFAKDAGAVFKDGFAATAVHISDGNAQVHLDNGEVVDSDVIVGADGVNSNIAKNTGLRQKRTEKGVCLIQEFDVDEKTMDEYFSESRHCYIHSRFKKVRGYGWVFPKKRHLNVGFGVIQGYRTVSQQQSLLECYQQYLSLLKEQNLIPQNLPETPVKGGALPEEPLEKTYSRRLLLIGDAAGLINPLSGEGIYYAMSSGKIAAGIIAEGFEKNDFTEHFLSKYQDRWQKVFGKEIDLILKVVKRGSVDYTDKVIKIASTDEKLTDMMMGVIAGELSVEEYKWKIIRRFFYSSLRNRLKREKK